MHKRERKIKKIYIAHHVFLEIVPNTGTRNKIAMFDLFVVPQIEPG
jgi:hypothetical protein